MPKIPVYDQQFDKQSVNLNTPMQAYQQIQIPDGAFGQGDAKAMATAGKGMTDTGTVLFKRQQDIKHEEDQTKALDAYAQLHDSLNVYLIGDGTPGSGVYNRSEGAAVGSVKEAREEIGKRIQEIAGTLENSDQQRQFHLRAQNLRVESLVGVARHEASQRREYQAGTYKAIAGKEAEYALLNYTQPDLAEQGLARGLEAVDSIAKLKGLSPEATEKLRSDFQSDALKKMALRAVADSNFQLAQRFKDDKRLTGEDVAAVESVLKPEMESAKAMKLAKDYAGDDPVKAAEALQAAATRGEISTKVAKEATGLIHQITSWKQSAQTHAEVLKDKAERKAQEDFALQYLKTREKDPVAASAMINPLNTPKGITGSTVNHLLALDKANAKGEDNEANLLNYDRLNRMSVENPEGFAAMDFTPELPHLSVSQAKQLMDRRTQILAGKKDTNLQTLHQAVETELNNFYDPKFRPKGENDGKAWDVSRANAYAAIDEALKTEQKDNQGKPVAPARAREIARGFLVDGALAGTGFLGIGRTEGKGFQIGGKDNFLPNQDQVPLPFQKAIQELKKQDKAATARFDQGNRQWYLVVDGQRFNYTPKR